MGTGEGGCQALAGHMRKLGCLCWGSPAAPLSGLRVFYRPGRSLVKTLRPAGILKSEPIDSGVGRSSKFEGDDASGWWSGSFLGAAPYLESYSHVASWRRSEASLTGR